jgi:YesN/AraC family two-component response regulator
MEFGYTTYVAKNGDIGVELYKSKKPDLVIMDMLMPFNGLDASNLIREFDSEARIILASAINGFYFRSMVGSTDLFTYILHKPMKKKDLVEAIKKSIK